MAGSVGDKYYDFFLGHHQWLENKETGDKMTTEQFDLFRLIGQTGSLTIAAEKAEMSYRKAWGLMKDAEKVLGLNLVETSRGGRQGGKSVLTEEGLKLIENFDLLDKEIDMAIKGITRDFFKRINDKSE